jgi:putative addiction module killer protein
MMEIKRTRYFSKWFDALNENIQNRVWKYITRAARGVFSTSKPVGEGVHEIRIDYQKGYRIYYTTKGKELIILLAGSYKDDQKKTIKIAKEIKHLLGGIK